MLPFAAMSATSDAPAAYRNAAGARNPVALLTEAIDEVRSRRRLIGYLVRADMKKRGADTLLGNIWWVLDPLLQMAVYYIFVTILARGLYPDYALFIFSAILPWKWFNAVITDATGSVVKSEQLIKQIAFPKIVLPISSATAGVVGFAFGLIPLLAVILVTDAGNAGTPGSITRLSPYFLLIPLIAVIQYVFTIAVAILVSAANVFFRDLGNVIRHFLRLWFYLSPGLYALERLDGIGFIRQNPIVRDLIGANPFAILFEAYRSVIYGVPAQGDLPATGPVPPDWTGLAVLLVASLVFLAVSTTIFKRLDPTFAKAL